MYLVDVIAVEMLTLWMNGFSRMVEYGFAFEEGCFGSWYLGRWPKVIMHLEGT